MKKILYSLLLPIICSVVLSNCSPAKKMVWHLNEVEKLQKKHPELADQVLDTAFTELIDSATISLEVDSTPVEIVVDSTALNKVIDELIVLQDSINSLKQKDSISQIEKEKLWRLSSRRREVINDVTKEILKDTAYTIQLRQQITTEDTIYTHVFSLTVKLEDGKISHDVKEVDVRIPTTKVDVSITGTFNRKVTLWAWIRSPFSLSLLLVLVILIVILIKKR